MKDLPSLFRQPARPKAASNDGYMLSSLELRAGLRVRELPASRLSPEILEELLRLRRTWPRK